MNTSVNTSRTLVLVQAHLPAMTFRLPDLTSNRKPLSILDWWLIKHRLSKVS